MRTILATLLVLILCSPPLLRAEGFGRDAEGIASTTIEDRIWANISSPASSGVLDSIKAWLTVTTEAHLVKLAVYKWSDTSFIDQSEEIDVPVGEGWVYFDLSGDSSVTASTEYALAVMAEATGGDCKIDIAIGGSSHAGQTTFTYGVWPTPKWTTADQGGTNRYSIWCFYTVEAAAAGQIIMIQ